MAWTTSSAVRSIINRPQIPRGRDLSSYIATAEAMINERLVPAGVYGNDYLSVMAMWLAAHFVVVDYRRKERVKAGDAEDEYEPTKPGDFLDSTEYGKQVQLLDYENLLDQKIKAKIVWLGKPWC